MLCLENAHVLHRRSNRVLAHQIARQGKVNDMIYNGQSMIFSVIGWNTYLHPLITSAVSCILMQLRYLAGLADLEYNLLALGIVEYRQVADLCAIFSSSFV